MEFLENIDELYYYIFFGTIFFIGGIIVKKKDDLKLSLKYFLWSYGIVMLLFSISLPHVFPSHFRDISDLDNKKMLYHIRENQDALAQTIEIVRMMAFMTFLFISIIIGSVLKYSKTEKSVEA